MNTGYPLTALPTRDRRSQPTRNPRKPLAIAGLCALAMAATWLVVTQVPFAYTHDAVTLGDFTRLSRPRIDLLGNWLLHLLEPGWFIAWGTVLVAVALVRGRPRVALAVALVLLLAPMTAEILKPLLAHAHAQVGGSAVRSVRAASWPSGHATAATALALCAVLVAPRRLRPAAAACGIGLVVAVSVALLVLAWHLPSDVLGGYLVASMWMALAIAALRAAERRWPTRLGRRGGAGAGRIPRRFDEPA
jgi:membrane-associated phospholipid phosphatase